MCFDGTMAQILLFAMKLEGRDHLLRVRKNRRPSRANLEKHAGDEFWAPRLYAPRIRNVILVPRWYFYQVFLKLPLPNTLCFAMILKGRQTPPEV